MMRILNDKDVLQVAGGVDFPSLLQTHLKTEILVYSIDETTWGSTGMGLEKPGYAYGAVLVPGAIVVAESKGVKGIYHISESGHVEFAGPCK